MKRESDVSYGVLPLCLQEASYRVFLVLHSSSCYWGFPKGHPEKNETPLEAAARELFEETGLEVISWMRQEPFIENYSFQKATSIVDKQVFFYPAITTTKSQIDSKEVLDGRWCGLHEALDVITFPEGKRLMQELIGWLKNRS